MYRSLLLLAFTLTPILVTAAEPAISSAITPSLRERLNDLHAVGADHWIYNDLEKAKEAARRENKPIFVTFRCVPCKSCASFDAEVAKGSELITTLARTQFIPLRLVEMKGVDLSQFEYDFDLNWAAMFINADGTVYGRYGTQSAQGPDAYNSVESLQKAMLRALELHRAYPANATQLAAKHPSKKPYATALEMPGLDRKERLRGQTERGNCIHCHNIHDAEQRQWLTEGKMSEDKLWRYPLPDNTGISIDPKDGTRIASILPGTPAEKAGLKSGDIVKQVNGQPVLSIADMQWVLHGLANAGDRVTFTVARGKDPVNATLELSKDWKRSDISWRGSMWSLRPRPGFWAVELKPEEVTAAGLAAGARAQKVQFIAKDAKDGDATKAAGLKVGDIITAIDGQPVSMTPKEFNVHVRLRKKLGDTLQLSILRQGQREQITIPLVDSQ